MKLIGSRVRSGERFACVSRRAILKIGASAPCVLAAIATGLEGCGRADRLASNRRKLGVSSPINTEVLSEFFDEMRRETARQASDIEVVVVQADGDAVKQLSDIEAFVAQGYGAILVLCLSPEGLDTVVASAVEKGIHVFNHSASPITNCTQNVVLAQYESGHAVGEFAARWLQEQHGGQGEIAFLTNRTDPFLQNRGQGLIDAIANRVPNAMVVGEGEANTVDLGASVTANLLQAHPEIKVLLSFADDPGFGAYRAAAEAGKNDPARFFIGSCDGTQLVFDKIAEQGIYQATWSYLFPLSAIQLMEDVEKALRGERVPPTRIQRGRLVTKENLKQIETILENPKAPNVTRFYNDPTVMQYSNERLTTPET